MVWPNSCQVKRLGLRQNVVPIDLINPLNEIFIGSIRSIRITIYLIVLVALQ